MKLKDRLSQPGFVLSALVHAGALAATLVAFSSNEKFEDQQETVPVEVVTDNQFNQIMKGDKSAKAVVPDAKAQTEQTASLETPETTPAPEATTPPPPPPPPQAQAQPAPPAPETPPPPMPPERPQPPVQQEAAPPVPAPPVPTPPIRDVEGEPMLPKPVPKPTPKPPPVPTPPVPTPPVVPHPTVPKVHEVHNPPPPPKPRPVEKPKPDLLAKLMDEQPPMDLAPPTPAAKPAPRKSKPAPETSPDSNFDPTDIQKLLNHGTAGQKATAAHDSQTASLGSPTASAPKMSPSFWAGLDGLMEDQYRQCWSYLGLTAGVKYVPQVRVVYGVDGSLQGQPQLINPPSDPALQSLADSALRAVRRCNPMKIPEQYAPYYDQWKGRVLRFDPEEMAG